jgi:hypothetical protein
VGRRRRRTATTSSPTCGCPTPTESNSGRVRERILAVPRGLGPLLGLQPQLQPRDRPLRLRAALRAERLRADTQPQSASRPTRATRPSPPITRCRSTPRIQRPMERVLDDAGVPRRTAVEAQVVAAVRRALRARLEGETAAVTGASAKTAPSQGLTRQPGPRFRRRTIRRARGPRSCPGCATERRWAGEQKPEEQPKRDDGLFERLKRRTQQLPIARSSAAEAASRRPPGQGSGRERGSARRRDARKAWRYSVSVAPRRRAACSKAPGGARRALDLIPCRRTTGCRRASARTSAARTST